MSRTESLQNSEKQSAIYSYLAKNGASRPSDITRGLDSTRQSIHNALKRLEKKGIVSNGDGRYRLKDQDTIIKIVDDLANKDVNAVNAGSERVNGDVSEASELVNDTGPRWLMKLVKELKLEIEALERRLAEGNGQINKITEAMIEERKRTDSVIMQQAKTIDDLSSQLQLTEAKNRTWWKFWSGSGLNLSRWIRRN